MRSSIEVPDAWPIQDIPDEHLAGYLRIARQEARDRRASLVAQRSDPAWIAATLDALPAAVLAVLHLVIGARGIIRQDTLLELTAARFGLSESDCGAAISEVVHRLLAVPLMSRSGERMLAVVQPAAALIAPLVAGLDLMELPAADFVTSEPPAQNPRMFLAACAAVGHAEIKLTTAGQIHRGSLKRLAKQVGVDEASLMELLASGLDVGVLWAEGDVVRLDLAGLAAAAEGRYPRYPALAVLAAQLGDAALEATAAVSMMRSRAPEHARLSRDALGHLPGFAVGTVKGVAACLRRPPGGTAAGHVTPSFEVFLPPESRLIDVVHVGACCEWERLDRAFVARISKPSIARAVAAGATAEQILAQLAAASRHPIPQNVEAAIRDWAGSAVSVTIATGHVIVVDPSASARVAPVLARMAARELAPGVFLVDADERIRDIVTALGRAGVHQREVSTVRDDVEADVGREPARASASPSAPDEAPGAARLRARVSAWRRGEPFEGVRDDFLDKQRAAQPAVPAAVPGRASLAMIERWAARLDSRSRRELPKLAAIANVVDLLPASELDALLEDCDDLDDLIAGVARLAAKHTRPGASSRSQVPSRGAFSGSSRPSPAAPSARRPPALLWQTEDLRERLQYAGRRGEVLALQVAGGIRYVEISRVIQRGTISMVLGDDRATGDAVALALDTIQALAALPADFDFAQVLPGAGDDFEDDDLEDDELEDDELDDVDATAVRKPWRPADGQVAPPGHVQCPCGSGQRYRHCCRAVITA